MKRYLILRKENKDKQYNPLEFIFTGWDKEKKELITGNAYETDSVKMFFSKKEANYIVDKLGNDYMISSVIGDMLNKLKRSCV